MGPAPLDMYKSRQARQELTRIDRSVAIVRRFVSKPVLVTAAVAALTLIGPGRALRWITRGTLWYGVAKRMLGTAGTLEEILLGPSTSADGTMNLVGALRRAMAMTGYTELKEFQRVEVVVQ